MPPEGFTIDAFHRGRLHLVQPKGRGHRAGLDAMLLAAVVPRSFAGQLADLGAGAGAAGLAVAVRAPRARVVLVENHAEMAQCARETLALPQNAALAGRVSIVEADVTLTGSRRAAAGLANHGFDGVIANPPFNDPKDRASPDPLRARAHAMEAGGLEAWIRTAAAMLRANGLFALIARPGSLRDLLNALDGRFGATDLVPVHSLPDREAIRVLLRARKGSRRRLAIRPAILLHPPGGRGFTAEADALINGDFDLFPAD